MSGAPRIHIAAFLFIATSLTRNVIGGDLYVDNIRGAHAGSGLQEAPFQSIKIAAKASKAGHALHLVPNDVPYTLEDVDPSGETDDAGE